MVERRDAKLGREQAAHLARPPHERRNRIGLRDLSSAQLDDLLGRVDLLDVCDRNLLKLAAQTASADDQVLRLIGQRPKADALDGADRALLLDDEIAVALPQRLERVGACVMAWQLNKPVRPFSRTF